MRVVAVSSMIVHGGGGSERPGEDNDRRLIVGG